MDVHFLTERVHSTKHLSPLQASENHLNIDDPEGDEDARACFPCPFCYVDIEIALLCSHLEEEHCFDFKNAVCPLCAADLGKDVSGHFTVQHAHSVKHRRKSRKSGFWTNSSTMLGKNLGELGGLGSCIGSNSMNDSHNVLESALDPLLSPFLFTKPVSNPKGNQQGECSTDADSITSDDKCTGPSSILDCTEEEDYEERRQRAAFCQVLVLSTIL
ncbi:protein DEHYDRATION-INDUCED 19 homolog 5-like [Cornus florida]|uniref:protein DEHYDRATION-INDUCED 19 homolog 5-like n=1 Tax=Cornus florida TaxID=4283 RepID=UPI002897B1D7|nr:protein DEHYDRATION-INDUCED 19 homolog 5-like [Cornus florida]